CTSFIPIQENCLRIRVVVYRIRCGGVAVARKADCRLEEFSCIQGSITLLRSGPSCGSTGDKRIERTPAVNAAIVTLQLISEVVNREAVGRASIEIQKVDFLRLGIINKHESVSTESRKIWFHHAERSGCGHCS